MSNLSWKRPFEVLYDQVPDCSSLRTIGCFCFAPNLGEKDKFGPRAHKCVLLGCIFGYKGYKIFDLQTKKISHSKDVLFKENMFLFKASPVTHFVAPNKAEDDPILPLLAPSFILDSLRSGTSSPFVQPLEPSSHCLAHNTSNPPLDNDVSHHSSWSPISARHDTVIHDLVSPHGHSSFNIVETHIRRSTRLKAPPA